MKKLVIIIGVLTMVIAAHLCFAQSQGVINYESKINMHRRLPPDRADMKSMIPEFRTSKTQLIFTESESLYKPVMDEEDDEFDNGGGMRMRISRPYSETYFNQATGQLLVKQDFFGKNYLITDSAKVDPWKFGTETKTIQGYECRQAYYTDDQNQNITAWFTTQLRPSLGPERFGSLPGAVLAVDVNNEERVIVATSIELRELKKNEIKVPKGGEEITRTAFKALVDEQMKKMGGNGMVIRTN